MGGGAAGFLIALPILGDILRCALCLGVLAGAGLSMKLWLDTHLAENLSTAEAAYLGWLSGVATAAVSWVVSFPIRLAFGDALGEFYMNREILPTSIKYLLRSTYTASFGEILMSLLLYTVVYGAMGALGGFLSLQFLFGSRRAETAAG